jgi:hypothetical protein
MYVSYCEDYDWYSPPDVFYLNWESGGVAAWCVPVDDSDSGNFYANQYCSQDVIDQVKALLWRHGAISIRQTR